MDKSERDCIFELEIWVVAGTLPFRNYIDVNSGEFIPTSLRIIRIYGGEQANHHDNVILLTRYSLKKISIRENRNLAKRERKEPQKQTGDNRSLRRSWGRSKKKPLWDDEPPSLRFNIGTET